MIKHMAKRLLSFVMIFYFVFLTLFGLGDYLYPDQIRRQIGEMPEEKLCFSFEEEEKVSLIPGEELEYRVMAFGFLPVKSVQVSFHPKTEVICGGEIFGVRMETEGLLVTALGSVETDKGAVMPGEVAGVQRGDVILKADGAPLKSAADLVKIVSRCGGDAVKLELMRQGEKQTVTLRPALSADGGGYKAGLWVRDGAAGIGTVTFQDPNSGAFAGLGHAVCDAQSGTAFPLKSGTVCTAKIEGIRRGDNGAPGELRGKLEKEEIGKVLSNSGTGIYGTLPLPSEESLKTVPIGFKEEVKPGKASLVCTLDGSGKKEYEIEIEEIIGKDRESKNFVLRITDPTLLERTGGIVQGMSGSPILQNGKLIGAVTHVLVGDPTRGYGIFIENMLSGMPE